MHHHHHRRPSKSISIKQPFPDPPLVYFSSWPLSFSSLLLSVLSVNFPWIYSQRHAGMWWRVGVRRGERESRAICSPRQSACVLGWADGGSGWHLGGMGTSAGRHEHHSTPLYLPSLSPSLLTLSPLARHIHSAALISTTCPHLSACRGGNNMGSSVWPGSWGVDEVYNQGNKRFILLLWTSDLM